MVRRYLMALALIAGSTACGGDAPEDADRPPGEEATITGVDYAYEDVPPSVPAGTTLAFTNASPTEAHELVLYRIDDEEARPLSELVRLPDSESAELITFTGASVALPGADGEVIDGDLIVADPGRYALVCFVPTGVDPQAYLDFVRAPAGSDPPAGGPAHVSQGMFAELVVE